MNIAENSGEATSSALAKAIAFLGMIILAVGMLYAPGRETMWPYFAIAYIVVARFAWDHFFVTRVPRQPAFD